MLWGVQPGSASGSPGAPDLVRPPAAPGACWPTRAPRPGRSSRCTGQAAARAASLVRGRGAGTLGCFGSVGSGPGTATSWNAVPARYQARPGEGALCGGHVSQATRFGVLSFRAAGGFGSSGAAGWRHGRSLPACCPPGCRRPRDGRGQRSPPGPRAARLRGPERAEGAAAGRVWALSSGGSPAAGAGPKGDPRGHSLPLVPG